MNKIVVATITCDFKAYSTARVVENNLGLEVPSGWEKLVYLNIQTSMEQEWGPLVWQHKNLYWDIWRWQSGWRPSRTKDQDQANRLPAIITARNMAREFALFQGAEAMLFVDSDVLVPKDSIVRLLETGRDVVGGLVPGRGAHSHVYYFPKDRKRVTDLIYRVPHGTAGFVLVRRRVFRHIPWSWDPDAHLSEDRLFGQKIDYWWYILIDLKAEHLDNPDRPLIEKETAGF